MNTNRREFMKTLGVCTLGAGAWNLAEQNPLLAAPPKTPARDCPTVVAIYLRGGVDTLSTIVPFRDPNYKSLRPTLALSAPGNKGDDVTLPLDDQFAFNNNMKELHGLFEKGICAPMICVGSPHPTRSHFDAQDFMERAAPGQRTVATGWLNRYLSETKTSRDANLRAVSLQSLLPRSLRGDYPVLAKPDQNADLALTMYSKIYPHVKPGMEGAAPAGNQHSRQAIQEFGARTVEQLAELTEVLSQPTKSKVKYPDTSFGRQMRDVAKVIAARRGLEVAALDYGGWDHHIDEGPVSGQLAKKLTDVSGAIGAFVEDLGPKQMQKVLVLVMSEFGRAVKENGNRGTDHGHGGFMLAIGGKVQGGKVYGQWTGLETDKLYERRDLPVHTDFRVAFAEVLKGVFGYDAIKAGLFPNYTSKSPPLDFVKSA